MSLTYDSVSKAPGSVSSAYSHLPSFGELWFTSLHRKLNISSTLQSAILSRGNGRLLSFTATGGVFTPGANRNETLVAITGGYRFTDVNGGIQEIYNSTGQLTSLATAQGKVLTFTYLAGDLASIQDNDGRVVRFEYGNAAGGSPGRRVTKITDTVGRAINAAYDAAGNLASLTWQDAKVRQFLYENTSFAWALTGVTDENTTRYATFGYDSMGRAVSTEYAGGVNRYSVAYGQAPTVSVVDSYDAGTNVLTRNRTWQIPTSPVLTTPNGTTSDMGVQSQFGMPAITTMSQPAGSGCAASTSTQSYDANGNVASSDDFSGQRSCFTNDLARNLPTVTVEGLANTANCATVLAPNASLPTGSRKVSTQWHPDWSLPIKAAQPLSLVTSIYNGQPDPFNSNVPASCAPAAAKTPDGKPIAVLCKQVVQATTDADGHLGLAATLDAAVAQRVSSFTYDAFGRMLTSTDPLSRVTTYSYYSSSTDFTDHSVNSDTSFDSVSLLLHGDGPNNSTVITDSGAAPKPMTAVGNARISTTQSKFGGASMLLPGVNANLVSTPASSAFDFGSGDATIEAWVYIAGDSPPDQDGFRGAFLVNTWSTSTHGGWTLGIMGSTTTTGTGLAFDGWDAAGVNGSLYRATASISKNTWHHIAAVVAGGTKHLFIDGVKQTVSTITIGTGYTQMRSFSALAIGGGLNPQYPIPFNGYIDDLRITKGVARYTANFTPPAQAFPNTGPVLDPNAVGHTVGDLQTITNAAGHVTQFPLYDRAGRVKKMIDVKGVVTDISYTPRGWVSSVTVAPPDDTATVTSYTYDNAGQLTGVTLPDATTISYSYDAAHRLVGVTDSKGNSVTYTLDNTGNQVGEQVKDPLGTLQRNITRVYDALNRVQQVTGASN